MSTILHSALSGTELHDIFHYVASSDPGAVGADKMWLDTTAPTAPLIKRRNSGNSGWITCGGSGSGGGGATFGAYGSRPAAATAGAGAIYKQTDGVIESISDGSNWQDFIYGMPITKIDPSAFTWVGQDASTILDYGYLLFTGDGASDLHLLVKTPPSTPYTVTVKWVNTRPLSDMNFDYANVFMAFRNSGSGKLHTFGFNHNGSFIIASQKYDSYTTYNSDYSSSAPAGLLFSKTDFSPCLCLRLADNGTNRICSYSIDGGQTFTTYHTVSRTDFFTPDQIGFGMDAYDTSRLSGKFLSWEEA